MYHLRFKEAARQITGLSVLVALLATVFAPMHFAFAAAITGQSDTLSTLSANTAADHTIVFTTPTGLTTGETIEITFTGFTTVSSLTTADVTVNGTNATTVTPSGDMVTIESPETVGAGGTVTILIGTNAGGTNQITNPASTGAATITVGGGASTFADSGDITVTILSDDQVSVSAEVGQTVTFSISDTEIGFGTLDSSATRYATFDASGDTSPQSAHNLTAGTNAASGYTITVQGTTLTSGGGDTIDAIGGTPEAPLTSSEQFGIRLEETGAGSGVVASPYDTANYAYDGMAAADVVASASAATANSDYAVWYIANIASLTPAGSYSTALTYVATANF